MLIYNSNDADEIFTIPGNGTILRPGSQYQAIQHHQARLSLIMITIFASLKVEIIYNEYHKKISPKLVSLPNIIQAIGDACYGDAGGSVWKWMKKRLGKMSS